MLKPCSSAVLRRSAWRCAGRAAPRRRRRAASRAPGAVGGRRHRHHRLSVRDDPPAARELSAGGPPSSTRRSTGRSSWWSKPSSTTSNPQELVGELARLGFSNGLPPLADRVPPAKRAALEAAIAKTRHSAPGASTGWKPGRRPSCCSATSSRTWASRAATASKPCCAAPSPSRASRSASSKPTPSSSAFSTRLPEDAQRAAARRRDRRAGRA